MRGFKTNRRAFFLLSLRFWMPLGIMVWFGVSMYLLYRRETGNRVGVKELGISPDLLTVTWVDYDQLMWIERGGKRIGAYSMLVLRSADMLKYEMTSRVRMDIEMFNQRIPIKMDIFVVMNDAFEMETFQGLLYAMGQEISVEALAEQTDFYFTIIGPEALVTGGEAASRMELDQSVMLADAILPVVSVSEKLQVGDEWETIASDPISGRFNVPVHVEVKAIELIEHEGEMIETFRVEETAGDIITTSWYDEEGKVVRVDMGNGLTMVKSRRQHIEAAYPEFKAELVWKDLDKKDIKKRAAETADLPQGELLPWLPRI